jgi:uncharacterized protein
MKVTLDTNFFISATQWDYSVAHKLLKKLILKDVKIYSTTEILDEFFGILQRDFKYPKEDAEEVVEKVVAFCTIIEPKEKVDVVKDDPDDNKIIECALASKSDYIITYDAAHLLPLKEYQGIKIVKPEELMKIL